MPSSPITVYVTLWNGTMGQGEAYYRGYSGPYPVTLTLGQWVTLSKPQSWRNVLEGGALNLERGEWLSWSVFVIPPFSFTPGKWIERTIDWVVDGLNHVINWSKELWDQQWQQNQGLAGMIRELTDDQGWIHNLLQTPEALAKLLLGPLYDELIKLPYFKQLTDLYNMLTEFLPDDWAELKNLITNPIDFFFDRLDEWLNEEVPP